MNLLSIMSWYVLQLPYLRTPSSEGRVADPTMLKLAVPGGYLFVRSIGNNLQFRSTESYYTGLKRVREPTKSV